jgi:hypothetical protein
MFLQLKNWVQIQRVVELNRRSFTAHCRQLWLLTVENYTDARIVSIPLLYTIVKKFLLIILEVSVHENFPRLNKTVFKYKV